MEGGCVTAERHNLTRSGMVELMAKTTLPRTS